MEAKEALGNKDNRLIKVAGVLLTTVTLAGLASSHDFAAEESYADLVEGCKIEYPSMRFSNAPGSGKYFAGAPGFIKPYEEFLGQRIEGQKNAYLESAERNDRIAEAVQAFAEGMATEANTNSTNYIFKRGGGPYDSDEAVAHDYEGYGNLSKEITNSEGDVVLYQRVEGVYRDKQGTYSVPSQPSVLYIGSKASESIFSAPWAWGHPACALLPGNDLSRGWNTEHLDFWPLTQRPPTGALQGSTYTTVRLNGAETLEGVQEVDERGLSRLQQHTGQ